MADKKPLGALILHGFTGSLDTVRPLIAPVEALGLPWRMPALRGHGTRYEDLAGVKYRDWVTDAEAALDDLLTECDRVVVVGLSMGGLVALTLGIERATAIAGLVLLAPALRFADPLTMLTPLLKLLFPYWDAPSSFQDKQLEAARSTNYKKFPTATFSQLLDFASEVERKLPLVRVPVVAFFTRRDQTVHRIVPKLLKDRVGGSYREVMFEQTGHEMLQDSEAEAVAKAVGEAIASFQTQPQRA